MDINKNGRSDFLDFIDALDDNPPLYNLLGFTIFDVFHIVFGIVFIVIAAIHREGEWQVEIAMEAVALIFAVLLIGFVDGLAEKSAWCDERNRNFTYAWLICSASLLTPLSIEAPRLLSEEINGTAVFLLTEDLLVLLAFACFFSTLWMKKHTRIWASIMYVGIFLILASVVFAIITAATTESGLTMVLEIIAAFAPVFPVATSIISFLHPKCDIEPHKHP